MSQIKYLNHNHSNISAEKKLNNVCGSCVDGKTKFTQSESKIIAQNIRPNFSASIKWRSISMKKMEQNEDSRSLPEVVIHTVLISQALVLSQLGNSLFCLALYRNIRRRTITNMYLLSLAMADVMMAIFVFPSLLVASGLSRWSFSQSFCQFTGLLTTFWAEFSLCILAITAINRYFCVMKLQRYASLFTKKNPSYWYFRFGLSYVFLTLYYISSFTSSTNDDQKTCTVE